MFDLGFSELMVIVALSVIVLGPQEIPKVMIFLGRLVRRLNYVRFAIARQFDDMMHQSGLDDVGDQVNFENHRRRGALNEREGDEDPDADVDPAPNADNPEARRP